MKKLGILSFLAFSLSVAAQTVSEDNTVVTKDIKETLALKGSEVRTKMDVEGSPYFFGDKYYSAYIGNSKQAVQARYNAVEDKIEYLMNGQVYSLFKFPEYSPVYFIDSEMTVYLKNYIYKDATVEGYLFKTFESGDAVLYTKLQKKFIPEKRSLDSFDKDLPDRYQDLPEVYFIQRNDGEIVEFPKNKKGLLEIFPEKKSFIEKNVKGYKMNTKDLSRVLTLITTGKV